MPASDYVARARDTAIDEVTSEEDEVITLIAGGRSVKSSLNNRS
jgi:hypothetical protein